MTYFIWIKRAGYSTVIEHMKYTGQRFTKRDHEHIVSKLKVCAFVTGYEYKLVADVFAVYNETSARLVLAYEAEIVVDGSAIDMKLYVNGEYIRTFNIAC